MRTVLLVDAFSLLPALQARLLKIQAVPSSIDPLCLLWLMNNFMSVLMLYAFCPCKAMYIEAFFASVTDRLPSFQKAVLICLCLLQLLQCGDRTAFFS